MAKLPDLNDLGARPVPVSRRGVASNSRAGAVGDALAGFGQAAGSIGQGMLEKEDRLAVAAAKSALLKADIVARQELEADPNYETWETRYAEKMKSAREAAGGLIRSKSDRALFETDAELDILRGSGELAKGARVRRVDSEIALADTSLGILSDVGLMAKDDATREATIATAMEINNALAAKGYITAQAAGERNRKWGNNYTVKRIEVLRAAGDLDGANKLFEASRGRLDDDQEIRLNAQLNDAIESRENLVIAEEAVYGAPGLAAPGPSAKPVTGSMDKMIAITAQSESGNRERSAGGRLITSSAGAQGRMQVMPGTARDPGHGIRPWDGKSDEDRSRVGRELLAALVRKYGDPAKAWAAYNWGESRVDKAVAKHGDRWLEHAPAETKGYVRKNVKALGGEVPTGGASPARHDLNGIYASIDVKAKEGGWTPERKEAVKAQAARLVQRDDNLLARREEDDFETALAKADALGVGFTNPSMLGDAYYRLPPSKRRAFDNMAEANLRRKAVKANGDVVRSLHRMAIDAPDQFAKANLGQYRPFMTPSEFDEVSTSQARVKENVGQWSPRTGIQNAIGWGKNFGGVDLKDDDDRYRVYRYMDVRAREFRAQNGGKAPTESDFQTFFREATAEVKFKESFMGFDALAPDSTGRAYDAPSANYKALIRRQFKAQFGRNPSDAEVQQWFEKMGEELK